MKESYERTELNITEFQQEDVIVTSTPDTDYNPWANTCCLSNNDQ